MSYQNFSNPPNAAGIATSSTTVVHSGQPTVAAQPMPYNPFAAKAGVTKKLGITQVVMGTISLIFGIVMIPVAPMYFGSISGGGIWSGIFIIIAGSLCIAAGSNPNIYATRCGALTMCIISILFLTASGILNFVGFAVGVSCSRDCYWDYYQQRNICYDNCEGFNGTGPYLSLIIAIMMLVLFVITLMSAIYTGRGCCSSGNQAQGYIITQPVAAPGGFIVSNYQETTHQGGPYPQQGYAPPTSTGYLPSSTAYSQSSTGYPPSSTGYPPSSTGYPPSSTGYPPSLTGYPPSSTGHPPSSTGYPQASSSNQPYPSQQYTQTSTAQASVTYGVDYSQQKSGDPTSLGEAPPPYNPNH